jgi:hypothetical protein
METESSIERANKLLVRIDELVGEETPEQLEERLKRREARQSRKD